VRDRRVRHQLAQGVGDAHRILGARRVNRFRGLDVRAENQDEVHRIEEPVGQLTRVAGPSIAHHAEQVFAGMEHTRHLRKTEQATIALERVDQAKKFGHRFLVGGRLLQLHQLFANALRELARLRQELLQQRIHRKTSPASSRTCARS